MRSELRSEASAMRGYGKAKRGAAIAMTDHGKEML